MLISNCRTQWPRIWSWRQPGMPYSTSVAALASGRFKFDKEPSKGKRGPGAGGILLLAIPGITLALGIWQTKRRRWKLDLLKELEEKTTLEPVSLPTNPDDAHAMEYRRVFVKGRFDHSKEMYLGPKSRVAANENQDGGLIGSSGNVGFFVITPLELSDSGQRILVNRGWVPKGGVNPLTRQEGQIEGTVEFLGTIRKSETRETFTPKNPEASNKWPVRDVYALAKRLDTDPIFVDASEESSVKGGPIGGQTRVKLRNDHLSYMITWYTLSAATLLGWLRMFKYI